MASSASLFAAASFGAEFASTGEKRTPTNVNSAIHEKRRSTGKSPLGGSEPMSFAAALLRQELRRLPSLGTNELDAAVQGPVLLRVVRNERAGEPVAVRDQSIGGDSLADEVFANRCGSPVGQFQVVGRFALIVGVALDLDPHLGVL